MKPLQTVGVVIGSLILLAVIFVGGREAGWWLARDNQKRGDLIKEESRSAQKGLAERAAQSVRAANDPNATPAAASFSRLEACGVIIDILPAYRTATLDTFYAQKCG